MIRRWWIRVVAWFVRPKCAHNWHPCVVTGYHAYGMGIKRARWCSLCKDWQPLTEQQFYSQFGESFFATAQRNVVATK